MNRIVAEDGYVALAKCRMCGGDTGAILLNTRLKKIKPGEEYDGKPCPACEERLKTMIYFMGNCGHSGFIKEKILTDVINVPELVNAIVEKRICRMEKCPVCINGLDINKMEKV